MWLSAIHRLQVGQEGSGGHSGVALSPKPRTPSGERRGRREGRDFPQRDPPPNQSHRNYAVPRPRIAHTGPQCKRREDGGPNARGPGARETQEGGPAATAGMRPRRGCSRFARLNSSEGRGQARAAPPPPAPASRAATVTPRGPALTSRERTRARRACSLEPAVLLTACSASRRGLTRLHASAPQSAKGGSAAAHPQVPPSAN